MTKSEVKALQMDLNSRGASLTVDGILGPKTQAAMKKYADAPKIKAHTNPALEEARKYRGQKEHEKKLQDKLVPYWKRVGLPGYKTLVGSSFAWCALFFFAMNSDVGQDVIASAGAKRIGQSGYEINYKKDGLPEGAGVWLNASNCKSASGNHITWASGSCTAKDINKPRATWVGFGGNQGNAARDSVYCAKGDCGSSRQVICRVFWHNKDLPPPVAVSKNCGGSSGNESTR